MGSARFEALEDERAVSDSQLLSLLQEQGPVLVDHSASVDIVTGTTYTAIVNELIDPKAAEPRGSER